MKPGTVSIAGSPAQMGIQGTSFVGYAQVALGTNVISVKATDSSGTAPPINTNLSSRIATRLRRLPLI